MSAEFTTKLQDLDERRLRQNWSDTARSWRSPKRNNLRGVHSPMASKPFMQRCRNWYSKLLRLYPKPYRERFGEPIEQTFADLCCERVKAERGLFSFVGIAVVTAFLVVCINFVQAADDINPAAKTYFWVPLVGIIGAAMGRFQPRGMTRALFDTALAQGLVLAIVLIVRNPQVTSWTPAVLRGFGLNAFFVMLFAGSALLFRCASQSLMRERKPAL